MNAHKDSASGPVEVGEGTFRYRVVENWPSLPADFDLVEVASVATDSRGRVYLFNRGQHPVAVFNSEGELLDTWGEDGFARAHGLTIGPDDALYCVDDLDHTLKKFSTDGRLLMTVGERGRFSDTGATTVDYRDIIRSGPPFNFPTNVALDSAGDLYVADGYGNARIHKFSATGELMFSWGEPGSGPGEFQIPHGIAIDGKGLVYVADRENSRIQRFSPNGRFVDEWTDVARPCDLFIGEDGTVYVAELGFRAGIWPGSEPYPPRATGGRVSIFDSNGRLRSQWGGGENPCAPGDFFAPHGLCVDAIGDIYVSEVTVSAGGNRGLVSRDCHCIQKFERLPA